MKAPHLFIFIVVIVSIIVVAEGKKREKSKKKKVHPMSDDCVNVGLLDYDYREAKVATCDFAESLSRDVWHVKKKTKQLGKKVDKLREDVDVLQGKETQLHRLFASYNSSFRRFCEIYTLGEAKEICKLTLGLKNPNPHFVHIPCEGGEDCHDTFWRMAQSCFRPNKGELAIFDCFVDPIGENCTEPVFLSCEGYTEKIAENWIIFPMNGSDVLRDKKKG